MFSNMTMLTNIFYPQYGPILFTLSKVYGIVRIKSSRIGLLRILILFVFVFDQNLFFNATDMS